MTYNYIYVLCDVSLREFTCGNTISERVPSEPIKRYATYHWINTGLPYFTNTTSNDLKELTLVHTQFTDQHITSSVGSLPL